MARRGLSRSEVESVYDRIGAWQDTQAFYEGPALDALIAHAEFDRARTIFEIGCGTGRVADRLLREECPPEARYEGVDLSRTMVERARGRLESFGERATVRQTDGRLAFDRPAGSQDRVLATYVLDLLSLEDAQALLREAHRLLASDGRLCVAGLTWGRTPVSRLISGLWDTVHAVRPRWVGGCRPVRVRALLDETRWRAEHHRVVTAWGVPSEVLVATPASIDTEGEPA